MNFRASFCDPFKPEIVEIGFVEKERILELFDSIKWKEYLEEMDFADESDIYYSPSLEIENADNKNGLSISAIDGTEWYIFFKRPHINKPNAVLPGNTEEENITHLTGQTEKDVRECLNALIRNDLAFLEEKII